MPRFHKLCDFVAPAFAVRRGRVPAALRFALAVFFLSPGTVGEPAFAGDVHFAKVFFKDGEVSIAPESDSKFLRKSSVIRTGSGGTVKFSLDEKLDGVVRVGPQSLFRIDTLPPTRVTLERGEICLLREQNHYDDTDEPEVFHKNLVLKVFTPNALVQMELAGCVIQSDDSGTWVKVFSDQVDVLELAGKTPRPKANPVNEGYKIFIGKNARGVVFERLQYKDYADWQKWVRPLYEIKDDRAHERLEKHLGW